MPNALTYLTFNDPQMLVTNLLLPFLLIFVVVWGMLNIIPLFTGPTGKKINMIIGLCVSTLVALSDGWGVIVTWLGAFLGQFTFVAFVGVFIIGVILWAIGRTRGAYVEHAKRTGNYAESIKDIDKRLKKIYTKMEEEEHRGNHKMVMSYQKEAEDLEDKRKYLYGLQTRR